MAKKFMFTILFVFMIPMLMFGEGFNLQSFKNSTLDKQQIYYNMQQEDDIWKEDSVEYDYEKSPGKAFLMSAIIPGAGEIYTGKWGRAAGFLGMEALFWTMHFVKKGEGEDIENEYKKYADNHWNLTDWANRYGEYNTGENKRDSHHFYVIVKVKENGDYVPQTGTEAEVTTASDYFEYLETIQEEYGAQDHIVEAIKSRDYYENIGKYDQFSYGWEDFETDSLVSDRRDHYTTRREDSNNALKMASQFGTAVIINHVVSAIHAQILAKNYKADENKAMAWNFSLMTDIRQKYLVNGINVSLRF